LSRARPGRISPPSSLRLARRRCQGHSDPWYVTSSGCAHPTAPIPEPRHSANVPHSVAVYANRAADAPNSIGACRSRRDNRRGSRRLDGHYTDQRGTVSPRSVHGIW
jgi:hypothetical protein